MLAGVGQERKDRRVLYAVAGLAAVVVPLVHLMVAQLSRAAAWVVTGIALLAFGSLLAVAARGARQAEEERTAGG